MKLLDERGIGTVWSICKEKFALVGHTHNYAGSGSPGGSANSAIGVVDYNQTGKTIQIGYSGTGITGDQIKYIAGYTDGSGNVNAKIKDVSKDALKSWLGLGSLAYSSSSIPTKLSQLNNDKGFVTGSVSGNTVTINGASTTWTNTWRGIQDNLTSSSTSDSLSANQGSILKELIDTKADSRDLSSYAHKSDAVKNISSIINKDLTGYGEQILKITYASNSLGEVKISNASNNSNGFMSISDKQKLDGIASGANNYTLPVASAGTLGGIKVSGTISNTDSSEYWPILVDSDGVVSTSINGLNRDKFNNAIINIAIKDNKFSSIYGTKAITRYYENDVIANLGIPDETGILALTSDIPTKTSQLVNDSGFLTSADKYTLPVASNTTLGGVKVSANASGTGWPICVDSNGLAQTKINGLTQGRSNFVSSLIVADEDDHSVEYKYNGIDVGFSDSVFTHIDFPSKSGTFALLSDIPDISNLCRFNFINSISECKDDRINFLFRCKESNIDLAPFDDYPDGTILLITGTADSTVIRHSSGDWFNSGYKVGATNIDYMSTENIKLITKYGGKVHYYNL